MVEFPRDPEQRPKLRAKKLGLRKTQSNSPQPQHRIGLGTADNLASELLAPEIEGSNGDRGGVHLRYHLAIDFEMSFLGWQCGAHRHVEKLGAVEADTGDVPLQRMLDLGGEVDVGEQLDFAAIAGYCRHHPHLEQRGLLFLVLPLPGLILTQFGGVGVKDDFPLERVQRQTARTLRLFARSAGTRR